MICGLLSYDRILQGVLALLELDIPVIAGVIVRLIN